MYRLVYPNSQREDSAIAQRRRRIGERLLIFVSCAVLPAAAQAPPEVSITSGAWFPPGLVISTDANLVELAATVSDKQGHLIGGLHASDFEVLDDKQPRAITVFSELRASAAGAASPAGTRTGGEIAGVAAAGPRSIALFFDDANASMFGLHKSAQAAEQLIANNLQPNDLVGIFTASGTVGVDFTRDKELLLAALARLRPHPLSGPHAFTSCPTLTPLDAYLIAHHVDPQTEWAKMVEAAGCNCPSPPSMQCIGEQRGKVDSAADMVWSLSGYRSTTTLDAIGIVIRHLAAAPPKRLMILMSPGFPVGGMDERTSSLMNAALRANIRIGGVNSEGLTFQSLPRGMVRNEFMGAAAKSTGGQYRHDTADLAESLRVVAAEPEVSYLLGFSPPGDPNGQLHSLTTLIPGNRKYRVDSRTGYFAAGAASERETAQQRIDRIAMSGDEIEDFPATLQLQQDPASGDEAMLHVTIAVDARGLRFPEKEGRRVEELTFLTVLEDSQGSFVAGKQSVMDMLLTPASLATTLQKGIRAATFFPVPRRGSYRVREVVREAVQNHIWASAAPIEIQ
jgi:VWFA-related protein